MNVFALVVVLLLALHWPPVKASPPLLLNIAEGSPSPRTITDHLAYLEDKDGQIDEQSVLRPEIDVRFAPAPKDSSDIRLGHTRSVYWFRLNVANTSAVPVERILEIAYAPLTRVELFQKVDRRLQKITEAGAELPFAERSIAYRNPSFELSLSERAQGSFYFRVTSTSALIVPAQLWSVVSFQEHVRQDDVLHAFYFGMAAAIVAFNILLFVRLRESTYMTYSAFVTLFAMGIAAQMGLTHQYLWPNAQGWPDRVNYILFSLALGMYIVFSRRMLDTATSTPQLDPWLRHGAIMMFLSAPVLGLSLPVGAQLAVVVYGAGVMALLVVSILCAVRGQRTAPLFLLAYAALFVGVVITTLRGLGLLPTNLLTVHGMQWGSAIEMVLLAFALADRFIRLKDEVAETQKELLVSRNEVVSAQATAIQTLKESESLLERRVKERTEQLELMNARLEKISRTDALTGLANRRQFDETLNAECSRAQRSAQPLSLALLDVDWFKKFNDCYGHQAGDVCLQRVASALASQVTRAGDLAARYGGEELAFIAPNTGGTAAVALAQGVCDAVAAMEQQHADSPFGKVTVSIGVVTLIPASDPCPQQLIRLADQALYESKRSGRARVTAIDFPAGQVLATHPTDLKTAALSSQ